MKPPAKRPPDTLPDTLPRSDVRELGADSGWAAWHDGAGRLEKQFSPTAPLTALAPIGGGDRRYAPTVPSALPVQVGRRGSAAPPPAPLEFELVMAEARRNNRICPRLAHWQVMYQLMAHTVRPGTVLPDTPLQGGSWSRTPALAKRIFFRDHLDWAHAHGCLHEVFEWMKALPEDAWYHMGD